MRGHRRDRSRSACPSVRSVRRTSTGPVPARRVDDDPHLRTGAERVREREDLDARLRSTSSAGRSSTSAAVFVCSGRSAVAPGASARALAAQPATLDSTSLPSGRTSVSVTWRSTSGAVVLIHRSALPLPAITVSLGERRGLVRDRVRRPAVPSSSRPGAATRPSRRRRRTASRRARAWRRRCSCRLPPAPVRLSTSVLPSPKYHGRACVPGHRPGREAALEARVRQARCGTGAVLEQDAQARIGFEGRPRVRERRGVGEAIGRQRDRGLPHLLTDDRRDDGGERRPLRHDLRDVDLQELDPPVEDRGHRASRCGHRSSRVNQTLSVPVKSSSMLAKYGPVCSSCQAPARKIGTLIRWTNRSGVSDGREPRRSTGDLRSSAARPAPDRAAPDSPDTSCRRHGCDRPPRPDRSRARPARRAVGRSPTTARSRR